MPSKYPRIGVVNDPELAEALRLTRPLLGPDKSMASLVRELAIRGADALSREPDAELLKWLVTEHGARLAEKSPADVLAELGPFGLPDPDDPTPASDALAIERADRVR